MTFVRVVMLVRERCGVFLLMGTRCVLMDVCAHCWDAACPTQHSRMPPDPVRKPEFLKRFPDARFHFKSGRLAQQGTFKGVWLNAEHTEWALEKEQQ